MKRGVALTAVLGLVLLVAFGAAARSQPVLSLRGALPAADSLSQTINAESAGWFVNALGNNFVRVLATNQDLYQAATGALPDAAQAVALPEGPQEALACATLLLNPGFETVSDWEVPITEFPAGYSQEQVFAGDWAMRTGITSGANTYSFSSAAQLSAEIPANVQSAQLIFHLFSQSSEPASMSVPQSLSEALSATTIPGDAQWVFLYDENGRELARLVSQRENSSEWFIYGVDLKPWKGQKVRVYATWAEADCLRR